MNHKLRAARLVAATVITAEAERRARPGSSERRALRLFKLERCADAAYALLTAQCAEIEDRILAHRYYLLLRRRLEAC